SEVVYDRHRLADPSSLMTGAGGLHRRLQPAPSRHLRKHRPGAATKDPICWTTTHNSHPQATEPPLTRQTPAQVFPPSTCPENRSEARETPIRGIPAAVVPAMGRERTQCRGVVRLAGEGVTPHPLCGRFWWCCCHQRLLVGFGN